MARRIAFLSFVSILLSSVVSSAGATGATRSLNLSVWDTQTALRIRSAEEARVVVQDVLKRMGCAVATETRCSDYGDGNYNCFTEASNCANIDIIDPLADKT